ncbi:MAG: hypothetical protein D6696_20310 [Acidobacteria bacterium]|nr:MAG: hypothetical protein D6696_20310 [Acidobacteriota bacterium]
MRAGSIVLLHLTDPGEKYWGMVESMQEAGVTLRGVNLSSFDDWLRAVASEERPSMGLVTVFFPMRRVECIFLDERVGAVESYVERFERATGRSLADYLARRD